MNFEKIKMRWLMMRKKHQLSAFPLNPKIRIKPQIRFHTILLSFPYVWSVLFFVFPTLLIVKVSLARSVFSLPPFTNLLQKLGDYFYGIQVCLGNYVVLFKDSFYFSALLSSAVLAAVATVFCLLIGYAMAYAICRTSRHYRIIFILLIILPFVTSFLIRVYSWISLLNIQGVINVALMKLHFIRTPFHFLDNNYVTCLVMVYCYLPFMILPIYATLDKIDDALIEASFDLGATRLRAFWRVTFPLSVPGILVGCALVFVPALGEFVIPELVGGNHTITIGQAIWTEFFNNRDWPLACAIAVVMMICFVFYALFSKMKGSLIKRKNRDLSLTDLSQESFKTPRLKQ